VKNPIDGGAGYGSRRFVLLFTLAAPAYAAVACSGGVSANGPDGGSAGPGGVDATTADGGVIPVPGDDASSAFDAISVQPPIDDADTPTSDAGPGGPWIAFVSNRAGTFDIYLVHPDGTDLHAVVTGPGTDLYPAWSPDGAKLAFASNRDSDGGLDRIFVLDVATGAISPIATGLTEAFSPAWSPDGAALVVGGPGGLYTVPATGGAASPLTSGGFRDNSPVWAPDGSVVYFASNRGDAGTFDVWSVKANGTAITRVTSGTGILGGPAVSRDGATIAFAQSAAVGTQVTFFAVATKAVSIFTSASDAEPSFSPGDHSLAVTSTRFAADNPEIVVLGIPGATAPFRLTHDPGVDGQATFQPGH
jgi:Tol biopolymer transport system component